MRVVKYVWLDFRLVIDVILRVVCQYVRVSEIYCKGLSGGEEVTARAPGTLLEW